MTLFTSWLTLFSNKFCGYIPDEVLMLSNNVNHGWKVTTGKSRGAGGSARSICIAHKATHNSRSKGTRRSASRADGSVDQTRAGTDGSTPFPMTTWKAGTVDWIIAARTRSGPCSPYRCGSRSTVTRLTSQYALATPPPLPTPRVASA